MNDNPYRYSIPFGDARAPMLLWFGWTDRQWALLATLPGETNPGEGNSMIVTIGSWN